MSFSRTSFATFQSFSSMALFSFSQFGVSCCSDFTCSSMGAVEIDSGLGYNDTFDSLYSVSNADTTTGCHETVNHFTCTLECWSWIRNVKFDVFQIALQCGDLNTDFPKNNQVLFKG